MRLRELARRSSRIASVALAAASLVAVGCGGSNPDDGGLVPSFYEPPRPLSPAAPGTVIKTGSVPDAPSGIRAQRIMYHSRTNRSEDIATTALLVMPGDDPPPGGFPLLAAAHGTTGVIQECAPSIHPFTPGPQSFEGMSFYEFFYEPWVKAGYAVVGADYQGEGAPGPYSFLVGTIEGQNVLDSVRAARNLEGAISDQLILYGHSQGGNSAGWAAEILPEYAPELSSSGAILAAPAASLFELLDLAYKGGPGATVPFEATTFLYLAALSYEASYDDLSANDILLGPNGPEGLPIFQNVCAGTGGTAFFVNQFVGGPDKPGEFFLPLEQYPQPWTDRINLNSLGNERIDTPILMVQGCKDTTIPISTNFTYFNDSLCADDEVVEFTTYPGQSHSGVVVAASAEMIAWAGRRLRGEPATSNCPAPPSCP